MAIPESQLNRILDLQQAISALAMGIHSAAVAAGAFASFADADCAAGMNVLAASQDRFAGQVQRYAEAGHQRQRPPALMASAIVLEFWNFQNEVARIHALFPRLPHENVSVTIRGAGKMVFALIEDLLAYPPAGPRASTGSDQDLVEKVMAHINFGLDDEPAVPQDSAPLRKFRLSEQGNASSE